MRGTSSPHVKLTGDFGNATEAIRIGNCFPFRVFAKNSWSCNFRLLQHNPLKATEVLRCRELTQWARRRPEQVRQRMKRKTEFAPSCSIAEEDFRDLMRPDAWASNTQMIGQDDDCASSLEKTDDVVVVGDEAAPMRDVAQTSTAERE